MKRKVEILIVIKDFDVRFPKATKLLSAKGYILHIREHPDLITEYEKNLLLPLINVLIPGPGFYSKEFLMQLTALRILCRMGSGMDSIDTHYLQSRGIAVTNTKGCNANAVAELTLGMILSLLRRIPQNNYNMKNNRWERNTGEELVGKTVGLFGFGLIARRLAHLLSPFEAKILIFDPFISQDTSLKERQNLVSLIDILQQSDIISLHAPSLPETHHIINRNNIAKMKNGVYIVTTARGTLIENEALLDALNSGKVLGAALDVHDPEPADFSRYPLIKHPNVISSPHMGGTTIESMELDSVTAAEKIIFQLESEIFS